jgi:hypothetical protein
MLAQDEQTAVHKQFSFFISYTIVGDPGVGITFLFAREERVVW